LYREKALRGLLVAIIMRADVLELVCSVDEKAWKKHQRQEMVLEK